MLLEIVCWFFRIPFHFKECETPVALLNIVKLLLLSGVPEIAIHISAGILVGFYALSGSLTNPKFYANFGIRRFCHMH